MSQLCFVVLPADNKEAQIDLHSLGVVICQTLASADAMAKFYGGSRKVYKLVEVSYHEGKVADSDAG